MRVLSDETERGSTKVVDEVSQKRVSSLTGGIARKTKAIRDVLRERIAPPRESLAGKDTILTVLARAADDPKFLRSMAEDTHEALNEYYTLTWEERAALASGDIQKIESWVGKLDERMATWLWCRLSQEEW